MKEYSISFMIPPKLGIATRTFYLKFEKTSQAISFAEENIKEKEVYVIKEI